MFFLLIIVSANANAYIGPGMGGGVLAAVFGFIAAFFIALWSILYYPIKRAIKKRKSEHKKIDNHSNE
jgi:hypothetical protein|tara:strand:- start:333 stop:536 length:204 start_codon:yes stop_codon:yes gene_type:complete